MDNDVFRQVKSRNDLNGILAMIWLRSGGTFAMNAADGPRPPLTTPAPANNAPPPPKRK